MQFDRGFTDEEIEANITTYFRGFPSNATLNPIPTLSSTGIPTKDHELIALAFLDAAVCIAAYCAALAAIAAQAALARRAERNVITISDYTIQVQGLPSAATSEQVFLLSSCICEFSPQLPAFGPIKLLSACSISSHGNILPFTHAAHLWLGVRGRYRLPLYCPHG